MSPKAAAASGQVTALLRAWSAGDSRAQEDLLPLVYQALREKAAAHLRHERKDHTLQPTALVHEAYLRLVAQRTAAWHGRLHFLALVSTVMRRVLVDHARARTAAKRPDASSRVVLEGDVATIDPPGCELLLLDQALSELANLDPRQARMLELVYFGGFTETEAADVLSTSRSTIARELRSAKAWLYRRMTILGAGGMGEVYRAQDTALGREVAIKVLPSEWIATPEHRARFEREARLLATLNHPNIGAIYGVVESDGIRGLVLELVDGETLAERIARERRGSRGLRLRNALNIALQVAEGRARGSSHSRRRGRSST